MPEVCPQGEKGCKKNDAYAIYPARLGVFPFLVSPPKEYKCEEELDEKYFPKGDLALTHSRFGLKVIRDAFVYLYFEKYNRWQYFHADRRGIFSGPKICSEHPGPASDCSRAAHFYNNSFITIPHAADPQNVWMFYAIDWLDLNARNKLKEDKELLMTKINLSALRARPLSPEKDLIAIGNGDDFDKIFEYQSGKDGTGNFTVEFGVFDEMGDVSSPSAPNPVSTNLAMQFFSGNPFSSDEDGDMKRHALSNGIAEAMNVCSAGKSQPIIAALFDSIGVAQELNHATEVAAAKYAIWTKRNAHPLSSGSHIENYIGIAAEKLKQVQTNPQKTGEKKWVGPYHPGGIATQVDVLESEPKNYASLELALSETWLEEFLALKEEQKRLEELIKACQVNHKNWIDLSSSGGGRFFELTLDVYRASNPDSLDPEHMLYEYSRAIKDLEHINYFTAEFDKFFKGNEMVTSWAAKLTRRTSTTSKEFTRDVWLPYIEDLAKKLALENQKILQHINIPPTTYLFQKARLDGLAKNLANATHGLIFFDVLTNIYALSQNKRSNKKERLQFNSALCLLAVNIRGQIVFARSYLPQAEGVAALNTTDMAISFCATEAKNVIRINSLKSVGEFVKRSSFISSIGSAFLTASNVFGILAADEARAEANEDGDLGAQIGQIALEGAFLLEIAKTLGARGIFGVKAQGWSKNKYSALFLVALFLVVFVYNAFQTPRLMKSHDVFFRRGFYGKGCKDNWLPKFNSVDEEDYSFGKTLYAIQTEKISETAYEFSFPSYEKLKAESKKPIYKVYFGLYPPSESGETQGNPTGRKEVPPGGAFEFASEKKKREEHEKKYPNQSYIGVHTNQCVRYFDSNFAESGVIRVDAHPYDQWVMRQPFYEEILDGDELNELGMWGRAKLNAQCTAAAVLAYTWYTVSYWPNPEDLPNFCCEVYVLVGEGINSRGEKKSFSQVFQDAEYFLKQKFGFNSALNITQEVFKVAEEDHFDHTTPVDSY